MITRETNADQWGLMRLRETTRVSRDTESIMNTNGDS